jgi:hypothetical protein
MVLPKNAPEITAKFGKIYTEKLPNGVMRIMVGNFSSAVEVKSELIMYALQALKTPLSQYMKTGNGPIITD